MIYCVGQLVTSIAGRDKGAPYVVVRTENNYVYVADGAARGIDNPKKKKLKHIQGSYSVSEELAERIRDGEAENYQLRRFLTHKGVENG